MSEHDTVQPSAPGAPGRFSHLPEPVRSEDMVTSQDVTAHPDPVGEADRERLWLLRVGGVL